MSPKKSVSQPKVSIVILNWNGKTDTNECLNSLKKITYQNYEVILVDNGSVDGSVEMLEKEYPKIVLIKNKENLGFTGGNNLGIKKALEHNAEYVLLLNNDTVVEPDFLDILIKSAEEDKTIGIAGPKILYYALPYIIWSAGGRFISLLGKARTVGIDEEDNNQYDEKKERAWVTGCVMLIRKEVFEAIGLLEEKYFSNYEDLDFCFQAKKKGFRITYTPHAIVYHKVARDWGGLDNPLYIYYQIRNNLLFIKRNIPFPHNIIPYLFLSLVSIPRRIVYLSTHGNFSRIPYFFFAVYDFLSGNFYKTTLPFSKKSKKNNQLRVGINIRFIQTTISGIGKYVLELVKGLARIDKTDDFILYEYGHTTVLKPVEQVNLHYVVLKLFTKWRSFRIFLEQFLFHGFIRKSYVDVFHGPSFMLPLIKSCKYVITVHDLTFVRYPESFTSGTNFYYWLFFRKSLKNADMIIADSQATKKDLIYYYAVHPRKIKVIYLGVDEKFQVIKDKKSIDSVRKKYNILKKFFLFTGMLSPRKNVEGTLKAFSKLSTEHTLVIVGAKGWLYEPIFKLVETLNIQKRVIFTGYIDAVDLPFIYNAAEALVFPSFYEGFGLPILEAMACGCPVITSNVSSMPEVAGDAALFINPNNIEDITQAMINIISNKKLRKQLVEKGYEQVKKFTWEKTAEETLSLYKQVANI